MSSINRRPLALLLSGVLLGGVLMPSAALAQQRPHDDGPQPQQDCAQQRDNDQLSSYRWARQYPESTSLGDLPEPAQSTVRRTIRDLQSSGAQVRVQLLVRPRERAYLMHYAWEVAQGRDPQGVPTMDGVDVQWTHRHWDCSVDWDASRQAAQDMVRTYNLHSEPALESGPAAGYALQLRITWNAPSGLQDLVQSR